MCLKQRTRGYSCLVLGPKGITGTLGKDMSNEQTRVGVTVRTVRIIPEIRTGTRKRVIVSVSVEELEDGQPETLTSTPTGTLT